MSSIEPMQSHAFALERGGENDSSAIVATFTTDSSGAYSVSLAPGTYCVVEPPETGPSVSVAQVHAPEADLQCLRALARQCEAVLEVPGGGDFTVTRDVPGPGCSPPCLHLPEPPSMRR